MSSQRAAPFASLKLESRLHLWQQTERGFSFIELIIAVVIFAIITAFAAPSFADILFDTRLSNIERSLASTLNGVRSEAGMRRSNVVLCARATNSSCGTNWSNGWIAFADEPGGTPLGIDAGEQVFKVQDSLLDNDLSLTMTQQAAWATGPSAAAAIIWTPRGRLGTTMFVLCDPRGVDSARSIVIAPSGAVRAYKVQHNDSTYRASPWGTSIYCPP